MAALGNAPNLEMVDVRGILQKPVSHTNNSSTLLEGYANTPLGEIITIYVI
ncbi:MAG: hypothetical protein F6K55_41980 [Moorea sp. SIO4A3]|nr:hypothetical protein [Moorena sp. SIO4A3]